MKYKIKKIIVILVTISIIIFLFRPTFTQSINGNKSISQLKNVNIGGQNQALLIRGHNKDNPLVLFLHGGPGLAQICYGGKYQSKLEEDFIVVNWDQRGSGKSYSLFMDKETLTKEQLVKDGIEVIEYLCKTYKKEKIIVVGHSWGSELAMKILKEDSSKILAYVGVGQVISQREGELISYNYAKELAKENKDDKALKILEKIGTPPYNEVVDGTLQKEKIISKYSPIKEGLNIKKDIVLGNLFSYECNGWDGIKYALGNKLSADKLWGQNPDYDLFSEMKSVAVPVYFCLGRYDYTTPSSLVEKYYKFLEAPSKKIIWFEKSSHYPQYTESDKFNKVLKDIVRY